MNIGTIYLNIIEGLANLIGNKADIRIMARTKDNGKGTGRPLIDIDWPQVEQLCKIQCTQEEIAAVVGCCLDTLQTRCADEIGVTFSEFYKQKKEGGKASLRRNQWKLAQDGNATMQIWLGKQYLDQIDKKEVTNKNNDPIKIEVVSPY